MPAKSAVASHVCLIQFLLHRFGSTAAFFPPKTLIKIENYVYGTREIIIRHFCCKIKWLSWLCCSIGGWHHSKHSKVRHKSLRYSLKFREPFDTRSAKLSITIFNHWDFGQRTLYAVAGPRSSKWRGPPLARTKGNYEQKTNNNNKKKWDTDKKNMNGSTCVRPTTIAKLWSDVRPHTTPSFLYWYGNLLDATRKSRLLSRPRHPFENVW